MFASGKTAAVASAANYVEDVFSTYLYTGNSSSQTITNNIDLSTYGGLVWTKKRDSSTTSDHFLMDTARGTQYALYSNSTTQQLDFNGIGVTAYNTNGYDLGGNTRVNGSGLNYVGWTFRKQAKFFDVVTYTGNGATSRNISHNLGSDPGCIIVKRTSGAASNWSVYHRSTGTGKRLILNQTLAVLTDADMFASVTSTTFSVSSNTDQNDNGETYVAYLFAHNAGGFGLTGTDNVISCGSYTGNGAAGGQLINLGYEAQWVMIKNVSSAADWWVLDTMRGWTVNGDFGSDQALFANSSAAEQGQVAGQPDAQGFRPIQDNVNQSGQTYIYIAIRRGPMKVPTSGTSVFSPNTANASAGTPIVTNFPVDLSISVATAGDTRYFSDRLRGVNSPGLTANQPWIASNSTGAELTNASIPRGWDNTQILLPPYYAGGPTVWWNMRRAPSFFDEVCYTGTGTAQNITHNLGVVPELWIVKKRSSGTNRPWRVGTGNGTTYMALNSVDASTSSSDPWNNTAPTASVFTVGIENATNESSATFVAYLFATCAGVSKVGSYTGNGSTQTINCGFTGGARFVLIKRTDSTGDWYVYDTARGMTTLTDPYLLLNSTAAESATLGSVTTVSTGFALNAGILAAINTNGASYIFLAIA